MRHRIAVLCALILAPTAPAQASPYTTFWTSSAWKVVTDQRKPDCFLETTSGYTTVMILVTSRETLMSIAVRNKHWKSIADRSELYVQTRFRKGGTIADHWGLLKAKGSNDDDMRPGFYFQANTDRFLNDIATSDAIIFERDDGPTIATIALNGSAEAVTQLRRCLAVAEKRPVLDPFAQ